MHKPVVEKGINAKGIKYTKTTEILYNGQVKVTVDFPESGTGQVFIDGEIYGLIGQSGNKGCKGPK